MALVYKTFGSESLDQFYGGETTPLTEAYQNGLSLMQQNPDRISGAARPLEAQGQLPKNTADDLDTYWLAGPNGAEVDRVIRLGYEQAIKLANGNEEPKPIETFVVTGASEHFELHICEGMHAVTVFMFVTDDRTYGSKRSSSKSWVVRVGGLRERTKKENLDFEDPPVVMTQVSGKDS
jgi:hypothetical protein